MLQDIFIVDDVLRGVRGESLAFWENMSFGVFGYID
jgi:hypothetical protein